MKLPLKMALALFFCSVMVAVSQASSVTINGSAWINNPNVGNAVIANVPLTTPDVTFQVVTSTGIDFDSRFPGNNYTVGTFLSTGVPPASSVVVNTPGALSNTADNTLYLFTGTVNVFIGETFTVTHDDGASFYINGTIIPGISPGPTAPVTTIITYTGPSLTAANLQIVYGECCGAPGVFQTDLPTGGNNPVPETSTLAMFGSGVIGLASLLRRKINL